MWTKCRSQLSQLLALAKGQSLTERVDRNSKNKVVIKFPEEPLHEQEQHLSDAGGLCAIAVEPAESCQKEKPVNILTPTQ